MTRGKFIVFEGGEGAGKSTQARRLIGFLEERNIPTVLTREPGGTVGAEAIRTLLLDPPAIGEGWGGRAEALLFAAARSDHVEKLIEPALAAGRWVVCDRFLASSVAYQGGAGGLGVHSLYELHQFGSAGMLPDLTLILTISPDLTRDRLAKRDGKHTDAISGRSAEYHRKVADAFATIAADPRHKACSIDANAAEDEVFASIRAAVQPLIEQRSR